MKPFQIALALFGVIVLCLSLGLFLRAEGIWETKTFGVAEQNAQTQVYEQSQAHKEGTQRDLEELYLSYVQEKDPATKQTILSIMRHRAEGAPADQVPAEVKAVLK